MWWDTKDALEQGTYEYPRKAGEPFDWIFARIPGQPVPARPILRESKRDIRIIEEPPPKEVRPHEQHGECQKDRNKYVSKPLLGCTCRHYAFPCRRAPRLTAIPGYPFVQWWNVVSLEPSLRKSSVTEMPS